VWWLPGMSCELFQVDRHQYNLDGMYIFKHRRLRHVSRCYICISSGGRSILLATALLPATGSALNDAWHPNVSAAWFLWQSCFVFSSRLAGRSACTSGMPCSARLALSLCLSLVLPASACMSALQGKA
jgi:hypothetical protein